MYPTSRATAKESESSEYFTGKECKNGHIALRKTLNGQCVECHKEIALARSKDPEVKKKLKDYYDMYKSRYGSLEHKMCSNARARAKKRNTPFTITPQDIKDIWPKDNLCPILGIELKHNFGSNIPWDNSPSLDCIKPKSGYIPGNIAVISGKANMLKSNEIDPAVFRKIADWLEIVIKD